MTLKEKILEIIGDEAKADEVISSLGEFTIPKAQYNKKVEELELIKNQSKEFQTKLEQVELEKMSEQEKLQHELEKASKVKEEYLLRTNRLTAEKMFVGAGLQEEDYKDLIDGLVHSDEEITKKVVGGVVGMLTKERDNAISKTKEELLNSTPNPSGTNNNEPPKQVEKKRFI